MILKLKKLEIKKSKKKSFPRWLKLSLYKNCFGEGEGKHLGLKFRGVYYCITHSHGNGVIIPKSALKMRKISNRLEYLKVCQSTPETLHITSMSIREDYIIQAIPELNK